MLLFFILRIKYLIIWFLLLSVNVPGKLNAQVLMDTAALKLIKETVDQMYNMRFAEAGKVCDKIALKYPDHPVILLLRGMISYWKNYPLISGTPESHEFEGLVRQCMARCENFDQGNEAEFLLVNMCARGSLLAYYADNELNSKILSMAGPTYRYLRRSFRFTGVFPDFYFFTGLYNYYREAYPEAHPAYKPIFAVFPRGSKETGLKQLRTAFEHSIFLKAEASTFLSSNYKYFENDYNDASYFSRTIYNAYPLNIVYLINCIEDMLLTKDYEGAQKLIDSPLAKTDNKYYQAQITIMTGILTEKKNNDLDKARQQYTEGIQEISKFGSYGDQYAAYAWFGLSRISGVNEDRHNQRAYRRKALDLTDFGKVNFDE
jgi:tetratricopeptide (TPR) repeat protein